MTSDPVLNIPEMVKNSSRLPLKKQLVKRRQLNSVEFDIRKWQDTSLSSMQCMSSVCAFC